MEVIFHNNAGSRTDAIHQLMEDGYTLKEATNIRRWVPKHFIPVWPARMPNSIEFCNAFRAVKDSREYPTCKFRFRFVKSYTGKTFDFSGDDRIEYSSPTLNVTIDSLEFIRRFGDGIWCTPADNEYSFGNVGFFKDDVFRLRRVELTECYRHIVRIFHDDLGLIEPTESFRSAATALDGYYRLWGARLDDSQFVTESGVTQYSININTAATRIMNNYPGVSELMIDILKPSLTNGLVKAPPENLNIKPVPSFSSLPFPHLENNEDGSFNFNIPSYESKGFSEEEWVSAYRRMFCA